VKVAVDLGVVEGVRWVDQFLALYLWILPVVGRPAAILIEEAANAFPLLRFWRALSEKLIFLFVGKLHTHGL
jgi:hypothetical protein